MLLVVHYTDYSWSYNTYTVLAHIVQKIASSFYQRIILKLIHLPGK